MQGLEEQLATIARSYRTDLFDLPPATYLDAEWVPRFDANFRLRTLLTIPEVFCTGISVANYLHFEGIAAAGAIVADETGVSRHTLRPNATGVHSQLLNRAFESLRQTAFALPGLEVTRLLCLMRVRDRLSNLGHGTDSTVEPWNLIRADLGFEESCSFEVPVQYSCHAAQALLAAVTASLRAEGITDETIAYCHSQFAMQRCDHPARVIGRALMHEYLADSMLVKIEEKIFQPLRSAWKRDCYELEVLPYFLAHRNDTEGSFVELEHAERMCAIASPFVRSPLMREPLLREATRFAIEQQNLFNALIPNSLEALRNAPPLRTARL